MKRTLILTGEVARKAACREVLAAPEGHAVTIGEPTRSLEQNAFLHAMLQYIANETTYRGRKRPVDFWRGLFVSGWEIATNRKPEIVPGLEGEFINIRRSTTKMSKRDFSELCEYIFAWGAAQGMDVARLSAESRQLEAA